MNNLQYKVFDWLRFPLIVGVVFIHCYGKPFNYDAIDFSNLSGIDFYNLLRVCISQVLTHICVPTFYFISGYLFFRGLEVWDYDKYVNKLKRRVRTLLVPFILWNTLFVLVSLHGVFRQEGWNGVLSFLSDNNYWHLYWDSNKWNLDRVNWLGGADISTSPCHFALWFLRDLMVVSVCSPLLYFIFKKIKTWSLVLLIICYISGIFIHVPGFSIMAFLYFGIGSYMKIFGYDPTMALYKFRYPIYVIAIGLLLVVTLLNGHNTKIGNLGADENFRGSLSQA